MRKILLFTFCCLTFTMAQNKRPEWIVQEIAPAKNQEYQFCRQYRLEPGIYEFGFYSSEADWLNQFRIGLISKAGKVVLIPQNKLLAQVDNRMAKKSFRFAVKEKDIVQIESWVQAPGYYRQRSIHIRKWTRQKKAMKLRYILFCAEDSNDYDYNDLIVYLRPIPMP